MTTGTTNPDAGTDAAVPISDLLARTTAASGVPRKVTDPGVLAKVARLLLGGDPGGEEGDT